MDIIRKKELICFY